MMLYPKWKYADLLGLLRLDQPQDGGDGDGGSEGGDGGGEGAGGDANANDAKASKAERKVPWEGQEFDAEKAAKLFKNLHTELEQAKATRDDFKKKFDEAENAKLTDQQRIEKERDELKETSSSLALENARLKAALAYKLDEDDLDLIGGTTPEQIAANAEKLAKRLGSGASAPTIRPKTKLRGGTDPSEDATETDPTKLAETIPRI